MKKSTLDDHELISTFLTTNSNASFEALYERYRGRVYQQCLALTKDDQTAQDYTQDIFIKVFKKLPTFQHRSTFSTWLYSISHYYCIDQLRINKRWSTESLSDELSTTLAEAHQAEDQEFQRQLIQVVLGKLSSIEVTLLQLRHEHDLPIKEISQQCGLSESAVKMRLVRSRTKLQDLVSTYL